MKFFSKFIDYLTLHPSILSVSVVAVLIALAIIVSGSPLPLFGIFIIPMMQSQQVMPHDDEPEPGEYDGGGAGFIK